MGLSLHLKNFLISDFQCHCEACANDDDRPFTKLEVMANIQTLRDIMGKPLVVTRGVSCALHNKAVGGSADSRHLPEHADAVDIAVGSSAQAWTLVGAAMAQGAWTAIRVYQHHVHMDARPLPAPIFISSPE